MASKTRTSNIHFMVNDKERAMIQKRMEQSGVKNMRSYLLKQAIDGRVIHIELESVNEMVRLLSNATNGIKMFFAKLIQSSARRISSEAHKRLDFKGFVGFSYFKIPIHFIFVADG